MLRPTEFFNLLHKVETDVHGAFEGLLGDYTLLTFKITLFARVVKMRVRVSSWRAMVVKLKSFILAYRSLILRHHHCSSCRHQWINSRSGILAKELLILCRHSGQIRDSNI